MKSNNFWVVSLKMILMSFFATVVSFMLNCLIVVVANDRFAAGDAVVTRIIMQAVGLFDQFIFIYGTLWDCGDADRTKINLNQGSFSKFRGVFMGFVCAVPYYLMAIAMMLMSFKVIPDITGFLRALSSQFWGIYTFILPVATGSVASADVSFAQSVATPAQAISACFVPTIIPILSYFPYIMGRKGKVIGENLVFKKKK